MKHIDLIVPTRNRIVKLRRMLDSLPKKIEDVTIDVIVVCDGDRGSAMAMFMDERANRVTYVKEHSGSVYCRNLVTASAKDAVFYATDDIVFSEGSFEAAIAAMKEHFPDDDGVIGWTQGNGGGCSPTAWALVGKTFLARYPGKKLFYPGYFHFSCQEIEFASRGLDKFYSEPAAHVTHFHPKDNPEEKDDTHYEARSKRGADKELSFSRQREGLVWGYTDFKEPA
jgi:hypothetical protein